MKKPAIVLVSAIAFCGWSLTACAPSGNDAEPQAANPPVKEGGAVAMDFASTVAPAIKKNCMGCHSGDQPADGKAFPAELTEEWAKSNARLMKQSAHELEEGKMPPENAPQPTAEESKAIIEWVKANIS